jgi:Carboxypeptidase regulatory-like domain/TonB dependent receptor-like, beta-barrel
MPVMRPISRGFSIFALALTGLFVDVGRVGAQVNTAVEALVVGSEGHPLPAVIVRVTRIESGTTREEITDGNGNARVAGIPPGTYDVTFEFQDGTLLVQKDVTLRVGQTVVLHATKQPTIETTVVVTAAAPMMDLRKIDSSTNIIPEQLESLPVPDRDFQRLAFIAPLVQRERGEFRFITGGPVIGAAGNASQSTVLVDGVDFTDPALGLAATRLSQDAIREFRVITNRFDAAVGGSAGGALSIVTRSGTNTLNGKAFAFFRGAALRAAGALDQGKSPYSRQQFGAAVGGPLVRSRTHLFGSVEQINENNVTLFRPGGLYEDLAADVEVPFNQSLLFSRLDHQLNTSSHLAMKVVYERFRQDNFRVGGAQDIAYGQQLNRDNWNLNTEHTWAGTGTKTNQFHVQIAKRRYEEPRNSTAPGEWFSSGNTLRTGGNPLGDLLGDGTFYELRDTYSVLRNRHELKLGFSAQHVRERSRIDVYQSGLFIYINDTRALPLAYVYGSGSADVRTTTTRIAGYAQDDWGLRPNLRLNLALRYDIDTNGNNPGFSHPLVPDGRPIDSNNVQPRAAFSWDIGGLGRYVIRGGAGLFTGRYLLTPLLAELQQNGVTGRVAQTRLNGALFGLPALALDPTHPESTGIPQRPDIGLMDRTLDAPSSIQISGGWTLRLGARDLFLDAEGVFADGRDEIIIRDKNFGGNTNPVRLNRAYNQINTYTNEGHSRYQAAILSLNGALRGGHLLTASYTLASKKNIADDFSPEFPFGYPNDPSNIEGEYGRSRNDERHRVILTAVLKVPYGLVVAPIYEYGSGQPWTHRLGYDFNGDGKNSDRPFGVERFGESGPSFNQLNLRVTKTLRLPRTRIDLIGEVFNLFNTTNFNVASIDTAEFLSGPTLASPAAPFVTSANFGRYLSTLPSREVQLGLRWAF